MSECQEGEQVERRHSSLIAQSLKEPDPTDGLTVETNSEIWRVEDTPRNFAAPLLQSQGHSFGASTFTVF